MTDSQSGDNSQPAKVTGWSAARKGLLLGIGSSVGYSLANIALKRLSGAGTDFAWDLWVTAMKAVPTVVAALVMLAWRYRNQLPIYPTRRPIPVLIVAALVMQFGGNLGFQLALRQIGMAITVPLVFCMIISAGALLGKSVLGDPLSRGTIRSFCVMMASVVVLARVASLNQSGPEDATDKIVWFGILMAVVSGASYGINGVAIRAIARDKLPVPSMLIIYSTTGVLFLGTWGASEMGMERLAAITVDQWGTMLIAGICNAFAFLCITNAFRLLNVSKVNLVNASQNAMCAIAGVLIFAEPCPPLLVLGVGLSITGLLLLDKS